VAAAIAVMVAAAEVAAAATPGPAAAGNPVEGSTNWIDP